MIKKDKNWIGWTIFALIIFTITWFAGKASRSLAITENEAASYFTTLTIFMAAGAFVASLAGASANKNKKWGEAVPSEHLVNFKIFTTVKILSDDLFIIKFKGEGDDKGRVFKLNEKVRGRELLKEGKDFIFVGVVIFLPPPDLKD